MHWYTAEGEPMHWVKGANGEMRDTTLRDARKPEHQWLPSVTGVQDIIAKPALIEWIKNQVLLAALTTPRPEGITDDEFIKIIKQSAKQEAEDAANRGTAIQDAIEGVWLGKSPTGDELLDDIAEEAVRQIITYCQTDKFTPEKIVVGDGYAGKTDLSNDDFVLDYKGKDITDKQWNAYKAGKNPYPAVAYPEQCQQLVAYDKALPRDISKVEVALITGSAQLAPRKLVNVFIDRQIPGRIIFHQWSGEEADTAWKVFQNALEIWQLTKKYVPEQCLQGD